MSLIRLLGCDLDLDNSEVLYDFQTLNPEDWTIVRHSPKWTIEPHAIIGGKADEEAHGQIFYKTPVEGDIVMEFDAEFVGDSYHDFVWWWGTSLDQDPWGTGYLGCLGGWWGNRAGIEKSPEFIPSAICDTCPVFPGKTYHIVSGGFDKTQFIAVDGKLIVNMTDPNPANKGYFGFGVYQSHVRYSNLKVYRPHFTTRPEGYLRDSAYKAQKQ